MIQLELFHFDKYLGNIWNNMNIFESPFEEINFDFNFELEFGARLILNCILIMTNMMTWLIS